MMPCALPLYCLLTNSMACEKFLSMTVSSKTRNPFFVGCTSLFTFSQTSRGRISSSAKYRFGSSSPHFLKTLSKMIFASSDLVEIFYPSIQFLLPRAHTLVYFDIHL